jgi:hypothetical protein
VMVASSGDNYAQSAGPMRFSTLRRRPEVFRLGQHPHTFESGAGVAIGWIALLALTVR